MKKLLAGFVVIAALALVPGGLAGGTGSLTSSATTVASGASFDLTGCVATSGDGGYVIVKGPNTFAQDYHFGPATPCSTFAVGTAGWAVGKYRINGYEFTAKGAKGIGSVTLTVT
jgi:hypothetical protein